MLSIHNDKFEYVLKTCGLVRYVSGKAIVLMNLWDKFRHEYRLHIEVTPLHVPKKYCLVRVGSWSAWHPSIIPKDIWGGIHCEIPKLRIAKVVMNFSSKIGKFYNESEGISSGVCEEEDSSSNDTASDVELDEMESKTVAEPFDVFPTIDLPNEHFALLNSLGLNKSYQINELVQEVVKLKSENGIIEYEKKNNRSGYLLEVPSMHCASRYGEAFARRSSFIDATVNALSKSAQCTEREGAECLIEALLNHHEEAFRGLAKHNGIAIAPEKKMSAVQVEAMLLESRVGKEASHILFCHLNQFFGQSLFESDHKRRAFFSDKDFPPTVKKLQLDDRTIIDFWYKEPGKLISHQIDVMVNESQLEGLKRVDLCVGGDHGGGKFRMSLKVLLRSEEKESISHLYQIASVTHPVDDSKILTPIGASLKIIVEGGCFFVQRNVTTNQLVANFNVTVSSNIIALLLYATNFCTYLFLFISFSFLFLIRKYYLSNL